MTAYKIFTFTTLLSALVFLISGCVPPQTGSGADISKPPVSGRQDHDLGQQALPTSPLQTEQSVTPSPESSSQQSIFGQMEETKIERITVSYDDVEFVQQRLIEYQAKLDQWLTLSKTEEESRLAEELSSQGIECVQLLERILTGYSLLLDRMQQNETVPVAKIATVDPKRMQRLDIAFLESRCSDVLFRDSQAQAGPTDEETLQPSFAEAQKTILSQVNSENYQEALSSYASLMQDFLGQEPAISTQLHYGLALQYSGQVEEAAKHFSKMRSSQELAVDPIGLQLEIADLFLASGNIAAAESYYESFIMAQQSIESEKQWAAEQLAFLRSVDPGSEDMRAYLELLREFQVYDYRIHSVALNEKINAFIAEHSGSPIADSALRLKTYTVAQLDSWFGRQLATIDLLVAEKKFTEAIEILKNMAHYYLPADLQAIVQKTYYEVAQAELLERENQRLIQEMELNEKWGTAVHLMDSQRYDEAIFAFDALTGTEYEDRANEKIVETANLAAGQMRKEAASLFIRAGKTQDIEKKRELLLNSHRMLNEILVRFPQTDLLEKVQQNITILEEQISKFDPTLLEELQKERPTQLPGESPGPFSRQQ